VPIAGTPAQAYLAMRGLPGAASEALRFHPRCPHPSGARLPALVGLIRDARTGAPQAIQRIAIRADGSGKAGIVPEKPTLGPVAGGAIVLAAPRGGAPLVIGEGVETAISAGRLIGAPAWAAVSAGNLACLPLPPDVRNIIIAADNDPPGQRAAWTAARRWRAEGRDVRVALPDRADQDFNDVLAMRARAAPEAAHAA
jgi:putative DNA primase/helicase